MPVFVVVDPSFGSYHYPCLVGAYNGHMDYSALQNGSWPDIRRIPGIIDNPEAIFYDKREPALLYVFSPQGESGKGKLVVRIDQPKGGGKIASAIKTGGLVETRNLKEPRYDLIRGSWSCG